MRNFIRAQYSRISSFILDLSSRFKKPASDLGRAGQVPRQLQTERSGYLHEVTLSKDYGNKSSHHGSKTQKTSGFFCSLRFSAARYYPIQKKNYTNSEAQNPSIRVSEQHEFLELTDFKSLKFRKGRSGGISNSFVSVIVVQRVRGGHTYLQLTRPTLSQHRCTTFLNN